MAETTTPRKSGAPSNVILIAAIVLGLVGMGVINSINQRLDPAEIEKREKEAEEKKDQETAKTAQDPHGPQASAGSADLNALAGFGEEKVLGDPKAKTEILFVWEWTPEVQADPGKVLNAIEAAHKGVPDAKIRVLNVDARPGKTPAIYVNGSSAMSAGRDGSFPAIPEAYKQMTMRMGQGSVPPAP